MGRALAALVAAGAATAGLGLGPIRPIPATAQPTADPARLSLVSQTPFVGAGGEFSMRLRVAKAGLPANTDVVVTIYRGIQTRSEFEQTLDDHISRLPAAPPATFPVASLNPDA